MIKATYIDAKDLQNLVLNKDGTYKIPDNIEIYIKPTIESQIEDWKKEIAEIEAMQEPSTEELIDMAKGLHPYYESQIRKDELIERLKEYEVKEIEPIIKK
jgi:hypothetical protein